MDKDRYGPILSLLRQGGNAILETLYPSYCEFCKESLPLHEVVCLSCRNDLAPLTPPYCLRCAYPFQDLLSSPEQCSNCRESRFRFEFVVVPYRMNDAFRELMHGFKYRKALYLTNFFVECLVEGFEEPRLQALDRSDWVISSVPIHPLRERKRYYDQAQILAQGVARRKKMSYRPLLDRIKPTLHQTQMSKAEREQNLKGAIQVRARVGMPLQVILVDDVFTTGATLDECAKQLREAGVQRVIALCVTRK